jgi:hypothetical protein
VPIVSRKGTGKMNVLNGPRTPRRPPRAETEAKLSRENISLPAGRPGPWEENTIGLTALEGYEEE